jgi:hypothetical protein
MTRFTPHRAYPQGASLPRDMPPSQARELCEPSAARHLALKGVDGAEHDQVPLAGVIELPCTLRESVVSGNGTPDPSSAADRGSLRDTPCALIGSGRRLTKSVAPPQLQEAAKRL